MDDESWEHRTPEISTTEITGSKRWKIRDYRYYGTMDHCEGVTTLPDGTYYRCGLCEEEDNTGMELYKNREDLFEHVINDHEYLDSTDISIVETNEIGDLIDYSSEVEERAKQILEKKGINIPLRYRDATLLVLNSQMDDVL